MQDKQLTRDQVLGLDIATHTGYFSLKESGTWDFSESKRIQKQHKRFRDTLMDYIQRNDIRQIIAEDVSVGRDAASFKSSVKLAEFRGILFEICDTLDLPDPVFINPASLKKWATGNGKATKEQMIRFCKLRWRTNPVDDNEADATHICMYYLKKFHI